MVRRAVAQKSCGENGVRLHQPAILTGIKARHAWVSPRKLRSSGLRLAVNARQNHVSMTKNSAQQFGASRIYESLASTFMQKLRSASFAACMRERDFSGTASLKCRGSIATRRRARALSAMRSAGTRDPRGWARGTFTFRPAKLSCRRIRDGCRSRPGPFQSTSSLQALRKYQAFNYRATCLDDGAFYSHPCTPGSQL